VIAMHATPVQEKAQYMEAQAMRARAARTVGLAGSCDVTSSRRQTNADDILKSLAELQQRLCSSRARLSEFAHRLGAALPSSPCEDDAKTIDPSAFTHRVAMLSSACHQTSSEIECLLGALEEVV
jgi:hypothetical protein